MKRRRVRRPRKRAVPKYKVNLSYLYEYEERIILADIAAIGGRASAHSLAFANAGRYDKPRLRQSLKRMTKSGALKAGGQRGGFHGRGATYDIPDKQREAA